MSNPPAGEGTKPGDRKRGSDGKWWIWSGSMWIPAGVKLPKSYKALGSRTGTYQ